MISLSYFLHVFTGTFLYPTRKSDINLARRGVIFNLAWGDFVEAGYPFMKRSSVVGWGARAGAGIGGAVVFVCGLRSSAYLPLPLALFLSDHSLHLTMACVAAFLPPFLAAIFHGVFFIKKMKGAALEHFSECAKSE